MMWKVAVLFTLASSIASAEPWLCKDEYGVKSFSYDPESAKNKNCVDHPIPSANHVRAQTPGAANARQRAGAFPKVDPKTQQRRDLARRQILERELAEEQKSLEMATQQLATLQSGSASEQYLKPYQDRVRLHETNIENLRKELGRSG